MDFPRFYRDGSMIRTKLPVLTESGSIALSDRGAIAGVAGLTITLPEYSAAMLGESYLIVNISNGSITMAAANGDHIQSSTGDVTSGTLAPNQSRSFIRETASAKWIATGMGQTLDQTAIEALIDSAVDAKVSSQEVVAVKGDRGDTGAQGADGKDTYQLWLQSGHSGTEFQFLASLQGPVGDAGAEGAVGSQGSTGATGATGSQGAKGDKGDTGETGSQGSTGSAGATGAQGSTGGTGAAGATGVKGDTGATGAAGSAGSTGATGAAGATGSAGVAGATGPAGVSGILSASVSRSMSALLLNAVDTFTVTVAGATTSMVAVVNQQGSSLASLGGIVDAYVSAANTVTVNVRASVALASGTLTFQVRVIP